jgi:hypothetical protein
MRQIKRVAVKFEARAVEHVNNAERGMARAANGIRAVDHGLEEPCDFCFPVHDPLHGSEDQFISGRTARAADPPRALPSTRSRPCS